MTNLRWRASATLTLVLVLLAGCDRFASVETRLTRATASLEAGQYQAALVDVRKALEDEPDNLEAQLLLVDIFAAGGETQPARIQLDRMIAAGVSPAVTEIRQIELLLSAGEFEAARNTIAASTTLPREQRDLFEARMLLLEKHPADAQALFERALAAKADLPDAALGRIQSIAAQGQTAKALQEVDALLMREPDSGRAWLLKGALAAQSADFTAAVNAFTTVIERGRGLTQLNLVQAHAQRIECYLAMRQLDEAKAALAGLDTVATGGVIVPLMRANVALADGDGTTAVNELRKFTSAVPQHMDSRLLLSAALLEQGNIEQAFAEAVRSVAEFGDKDEPRLALAGIQLRMGRVADAEETLQPLIARSPPNPSATAMLAEIRIRRGEAVAGISLLEQNLAATPGNAQLQLQLAAAYLSADEAKQALDILATIKDGPFAAGRDRLRVIATAALQGPAAAAKELDAAVTEHPLDVDLLLMAAAYQASTNGIDLARGYLEKARTVRPDDPVLTLTLGRFELSAGRVDQAEELARNVINKAPNDAGAMMLMAGVSALRGQEQDVDAWLNRARIAKPDALDVRLALARRAAARGDTNEARNVLSEAVRNAPSDPMARIALADLNAGTGRYAEALSNLRDAAKEQPNSPFILLAMAKVQLAEKDTAGARRSLKQALEISPAWIPGATTLAALETSDGNLPAALEVVRNVRRSDPEGAASYALEGDVYMAAKRPTEAANAFLAAYKRVPSAVLAMRVGQAKSAAKIANPQAELADWVARTPADALARRSLAEYHMSAGRNAAAVTELEKVVEARPKDVAALNNLAWLYLLAKDPRATAVAERAYADAPNIAAVADTYGWILVQTNNLEKGLPALQQAASLAPDDAQIQFHYAHALSEANQKERAIAILSRVIDSGKQFESRAEAEQLLRKLNIG